MDELQDQSTRRIHHERYHNHHLLSVYSLCHEFLQIMAYSDDEPASVSNAEVMTVPLVASLYFGGNAATGKRVTRFCTEHGYLPIRLLPT
jgi:hypothetical protein